MSTPLSKAKAKLADMPVELLRAAVNYDASSGVFTRLTASPGHRVGEEMGWVNRNGYCRTRIGNQTYSLHRMAWAYVYGRWPADQIDHINGDRSDNRIENLREANAYENGQNLKKKKHNKSGFIGVTWHKKQKMWCAQIMYMRHQNHLGFFDSPEAASKAYLEAKSKLHSFQPVPR